MKIVSTFMFLSGKITSVNAYWRIDTGMNYEFIEWYFFLLSMFGYAVYVQLKYIDALFMLYVFTCLVCLALMLMVNQGKRFACIRFIKYLFTFSSFIVCDNYLINSWNSYYKISTANLIHCSSWIIVIILIGENWNS